MHTELCNSITVLWFGGSIVWFVFSRWRGKELFGLNYLVVKEKGYCRGDKGSTIKLRVLLKGKKCFGEVWWWIIDEVVKSDGPPSLSWRLTCWG